MPPYEQLETQDYWQRVNECRAAPSLRVEYGPLVNNAMIYDLPDVECACRYGGTSCRGPKYTGLDIDWERLELR